MRSLAAVKARHNKAYHAKYHANSEYRANKRARYHEMSAYVKHMLLAKARARTAAYGPPNEITKMRQSRMHSARCRDSTEIEKKRRVRCQRQHTRRRNLVPHPTSHYRDQRLVLETKSHIFDACERTLSCRLARVPRNRRVKSCRTRGRRTPLTMRSRVPDVSERGTCSVV